MYMSNNCFEIRQRLYMYISYPHELTLFHENIATSQRIPSFFVYSFRDIYVKTWQTWYGMFSSYMHQNMSYVFDMSLYSMLVENIANTLSQGEWTRNSRFVAPNLHVRGAIAPSRFGCDESTCFASILRLKMHSDMQLVILFLPLIQMHMITSDVGRS